MFGRKTAKSEPFFGYTLTLTMILLCACLGDLKDWFSAIQIWHWYKIFIQIHCLDSYQLPITVHYQSNSLNLEMLIGIELLMFN